MKVAVSSSGASLDALVDPRFGRCSYYIIFDTETKQFEAVPNTSAQAFSGAGIQAAQTIVQSGARAVITGNVGPNAFQVLKSAGIRIFLAAGITVSEAIEKFKRGELQESIAPVGAGFGMGRGTGMGRGMGGGFGRRWTPP